MEAVKAEVSTLHPSLELVGQIIAIPEHTAVVSSQSGGWVASVVVVEEQSVHAGDVLVTLDMRLANSDLLRAKATLSEKKAALAKLQRGNLPEEIDASREARENAKANLESIRTEFSALEELFRR
ncbi:MAG TPA: biotin/lipoyl-binding protein, partial [Lacipirellulaceae bacterium]|nr:biotin/lipoyl-binding protein [Lacipirellulaceae bacterium]